MDLRELKFVTINTKMFLIVCIGSLLFIFGCSKETPDIQKAQEKGKPLLQTTVWPYTAPGTIQFYDDGSGECLNTTEDCFHYDDKGHTDIVWPDDGVAIRLEEDTPREFIGTTYYFEGDEATGSITELDFESNGGGTFYYHIDSGITATRDIAP